MPCSARALLSWSTFLVSLIDFFVQCHQVFNARRALIMKILAHAVDALFHRVSSGKRALSGIFFESGSRFYQIAKQFGRFHGFFQPALRLFHGLAVGAYSSQPYILGDFTGFVRDFAFLFAHAVCLYSIRVWIEDNAFGASVKAD